jgi:inorganic pyrophosphatase
MKMLDQGDADDKIIAVHADDPEYGPYNSLEELPAHRMNEIKRFFLDYKTLENKSVVVEHFIDRAQALAVIDAAVRLYDEKKKSLMSGGL